MGFKGDFQNIGLSDVFQNIASNRLGGTLRISTGKDERYIYFDRGEISMVSHGQTKRKPLSEVFVRAGRISPSDHTRLVRKKEKSRKQLLDLLAELGIMDTEEFQRSVRSHVEEEVYEIFGWRSAQFEFDEGPPSPEIFDPDQQAAKVAIQSTSLMMEAMRRLDEWEKIQKRLPSLREILALASPAGAQGEVPGGEVGRAVVAAVDGKKSVQALVDELPHTKFAIASAVHQLIEAGVLRTLDETERLALAGTLARAGRQAEALEIYRLSLEMDPRRHDVRRAYARLLQETGRREEAASEVKLLAHLLLEDRHKAEALEAYRWAVDLLPNDTVAREKVYALVREIGSDDDVLQHGRGLAQLYRTVGLGEKARDVYVELLEIRPRDADLEELIAKTHLELGDAKKAASRYRSAARLHLEDRNYDEAAEIYEQILKIDPDNPEAQKLIVQIREGKIALRKERMRKSATSFVATVFIVVLLGGIGYEALARRAHYRAQLRSINLIRSGELAAAINQYSTVLKRYRYSFSSLEAKGVVIQLAAWHVETEDRADLLEQFLRDWPNLPVEIRDAGRTRIWKLKLTAWARSYAKRPKGPEDPEPELEEIRAIRDSRAARPMLEVHREIRGEPWAVSFDEAMLAAMENMTDVAGVLDVLVSWLVEIDRDYPKEPEKVATHRVRIRGILSILTGRKEDALLDEALDAEHWKKVAPYEKAP